MKRFFKSTASVLTLFLLMLIGIPAQKALAQPGVEVSFQTFYDDLAPYGQWIDDPQYGYVWVPDVDADFRPYYTDGQWVMTDYGNTWVSNYPWGWAAFHYGRWTYDDYYGWIWIPGSEWGPAWVNWREGYGYYGWAPLGPGVVIGAYYGNYYCPDDWWVFLPPQYLYRPRYYGYWHGPRDNRNIIRNTTIINNTFINHTRNVTYVTGPRADDVQRLTNRPVTTYHLSAMNTPGRARISNGSVSMFRPLEVSKAAPNGARPAPPRVVNTPQPIGRPQAVGANSGQPAPFHRGEAPRPAPQQIQPQQSQQQAPSQFPMQHTNPNAPVQRPVDQFQERQQPQAPAQRPQPQFQQPQRPQPAPQPQYRPQPVPQPQYRPQPAPQPQYRPQPMPQPQYRPAPQPQFRPQPAPAPRPAPAPSRPAPSSFHR